MTDDFADFLTQEEINEILAVEEEYGVDIALDDILNEIDEEDSDWAE